MGKYSIRDLEKLSGIKAHTLRIWEQRYSILKPDRTDTNIRTYDDDDLKNLLNISLLNGRGHKISHIAEMSEDQIRSEVNACWECCEEYESQINSLILAMIELDEERFEKVMAKNVLQLGFTSTMMNVVYPMFQKIGIMWQACSINPAQEHFLSNLVRQKIIVAIDGQHPRKNPEAPKWLLFLPEGEYHEIGLLLAHYLIREKQFTSVYLGQSVPFEDILSTHKTYAPQNLFTIFTSGWNPESGLEYLKLLSGSFPMATIHVSGPVTAEIQAEIPGNVIILSCMNDLVKKLKAS